MGLGFLNPALEDLHYSRTAQSLDAMQDLVAQSNYPFTPNLDSWVFEQLVSLFAAR